MKRLDVLEHLDRNAAAVGFIATYEFDPQFFERRVLTKKAFGAADRVIVFMDQGRYQEVVNGGLIVGGFNRRYLVIPVSCAPEAFHPKLYLSIGDKAADAIVGSSNCTAGGIGYNLELCSAFSVRHDGAAANEQDLRSVVRQIYDAMKSFAAEAGPLKEVAEAEFFKPAEARIPWLDAKVSIPKGAIEVIHSHEAPLWDQLTSRLQGRAVRKIAVIAPFYDGELGFLKRLRQQWPDAALTVVAQPEYATLAGQKLSKLFASGKHRLIAATPQPGRRLHAKAFAFETSAGNFWLSGSPNATLAAFDGRNTEAAIWVNTKEKAQDLLEGSGLKLETIDPREFKAGPHDEFAPAATPTEMLLDSAVLRNDGRLDCELRVPDTVRELTVTIQNFNEPHPVIHLPIRPRAPGKFVLELAENQISQIRAAAVCQVRGVAPSGQAVTSNRTAVVQLYQLLRERPAAHGGSNPLRRIEETGENLIPYVDNLGSVREAIEFFNNCSIRFNDGETANHGGRRDIWKARDPFKPDTPPNWSDLPVGTSAEELREAIRSFVERHQHEKLYRHVGRGNLNGLPNFLDIFRTLNGLLFAYHARGVAGAGPVIPAPYVTTYVMQNLELLIGPFELREDAFEGNGFVAAIYANFHGGKTLVRERLREERVPQMLRAAAEAMVDVRRVSRKMPSLDAWAIRRLRWVSDWIGSQGQTQPTAEDIRAARLEYLPAESAA
ncbi:MAG TPA: hypothetical protein VK438_06120 [Xanthobacteraceae bacterium]|nr:hypothetical protein [Xanthobacteraceae bacterium]